jgi:hypothetical protein
VTQKPYIPFQIGYQTLFPKTMIDGISFWAKKGSGGSDINVSLKGNEFDGLSFEN